MERDGDLGYLAVKPQVDKDTAITPTIYLSAYSMKIRTNRNFQAQNPVVGSKQRNRKTLPGMRQHTGTLELEGEVNTVVYAYDMFLTRGTETGSGPYTNPFTASKTVSPKYYTADVSRVSHVERYIGLAISEIEELWQDNELRLSCAVACLKTWHGRTVLSVTGSGPYTITFDQTYDRKPAVGLVVGDIMQLYDVSADAYINFTVASIPSDVAVTCVADVSAGAVGDFVTIRPATSPSYSLGPTFERANTEYRFADTAANALTAAHTPLDDGTTLKLMHPFQEDGGVNRSGSYDPASLPRMQTGYEFTARQYFDEPMEMQRYTNMVKRACVIRHFAYSGTTVYEYRVTLNNMTQDNPLPDVESENNLYSEIVMHDNYDGSDAAGMGVTTISAATLG